MVHIALLLALLAQPYPEEGPVEIEMQVQMQMQELDMALDGLLEFEDDLLEMEEYIHEDPLGDDDDY